MSGPDEVVPYGRLVPAPWSQAFDFYFCTIEGIVYSTGIDMAAGDHAPLGSHPIFAVVRVAMKNPQDDGLRSAEESEALFELEDRVTKTLANGVDAIQIGWRIGSGRSDFHFYLPQAGAKRFESLLGTVDWGGYDAKGRAADDSDWENYWSDYPGTFHRHTMQNRAVQLELAEQGDSLRKRRWIDHTALFPSRESAEESASRLKKARFRIVGIDVDSDPLGEQVALMFRRKDSCAGMRPDEVTIEILDAIEPTGGIYDGWGCLIRR